MSVIGPRVAIASLAEEAQDSERTVLGSLLLEPGRLQQLSIDGSQFSEHHRKIFDVILALSIEHGDFDSMAIIELLRKRGHLPAGGAAYVTSLPDGMPRHIALDQHCAKIKAANLRRRLARLCESIMSGCYDLVADPSDLLARLRDEAATIDGASSRESTLGLVCASQVKAESTEWLIEPYIPRACLSLLVGDPGDGKTWVGLSLAAGLTRGLIPFSGPCARQSVFYLSNEDGAGQLRARFDQLGGDPSRAWFESADRAINLGHAAAIEAAVQTHGASLIIIDTVTSHFGAQADFHKANEVSAVMGPLAALAQRTGAAVLGLMHLSKSMQGKSLYRIQGSTAFAGAARSVLAVGRDPSDPSKRILAHLKVNGSAEGSSRTFSIDGDGVAWGEVSNLRAADVMGPETNAEDRGELSAACEFLAEALRHGSREAAEVRDEAKEAGISARTLARAKAALKIKSRKTSLKGGWIWWSPEQCHEEGQACQP